jgi:hypothetical protein
LEAIRKHFEKQFTLYGPQVVCSLVEKEGREGIIATAYRSYLHELNNENIRMIEFDVHQGQCETFMF